MTLSNKASDELNDLLYAFYQECEGAPLEVMKPDGDLLPTWAICLLLIAMSAVVGCTCALVVRIVL